MTRFADLGLSEDLLLALKEKGFEEPTKIQESIIPLFLNTTKDIIGQAQTGTGKTAAFSLPILQVIESKKTPQVLVLAPTRELALQVAEEMNSLRGKKDLKVVPIYGGQSLEQQIKKVRSGADIIVGTPGRVIDLMGRKVLNFSQVSHFVLDEADEMLNMGFIEDIEHILEVLPANRRTLLFSATMPKKILDLSRRYMKDSETVNIQKEAATSTQVDQIYFELSEHEKFDALCRIIDIEDQFYGLVFCRTKNDTDLVAHKLLDRGYNAEALHGDVSQEKREKILKRLKAKKLEILVATDVAARGIDVNDLTHVINYSLPQDPESYVHRIGRTGRAGKLGVAITFVTHREYRDLAFIQRITKTNIRRESLPKVEDIILTKVKGIRDKVLTGSTADFEKIYITLAKDLLSQDIPAENVIASLIRLGFKKDLDESQYAPVSNALVPSGIVRLYIGIGKMDSATPEKVKDFIVKHAKVSKESIQEIEVQRSFSLISVPFKEAEHILQTFKHEKRGRNPLVKKDRRI